MIGTAAIPFGYRHILLAFIRAEPIEGATVGRVWIGTRRHVEHLQRLAVVFAAMIRLKIVTELYQREMSPKQFQAEFGGGTVSRLSKHFAKLVENGWLRPVRTRGPGGKRRGGTETVYRATELAFCDRETWSVLPYSIRIAFSWNTFKEVAEQLRRAMEASTFQSRPDRHLTGMRLLFDKVGYERVAGAVAEEFASQFEEQDDARRRADHDNKKLFRIGSLLLDFELPTRDDQRVGPRLVEDREPAIPFPVRVSKVFEDEVCMQIMDDANRGDVSVPMFVRKFGDRFGLDEVTIRRRFTKLVDAGWLREVARKTGGRRKGGVEKFFRATGPALDEEDVNGPWANVPDALAKTEDWRTFSQFSNWGKAATAAGTLNRRDDVCIAWSILNLDQQGWERVTKSLKRLHAFIRKEHELAQVRLRRSGEEPIAMAVALGAFETPPPIKDH